MLIKKPRDIKPSEITPKDLYLNRRQFLLSASATAISAAQSSADSMLLSQPNGRWRGKNSAICTAPTAPLKNRIHSRTSPLTITSMNSAPTKATRRKTPNTLPLVLGRCPSKAKSRKPKTYDIDELIKVAPLEERIYRMRCVEAWSMVIPWVGFPLNALVKLAEPTGDAKYIQFVTLQDPKRMPGQKIVSWTGLMSKDCAWTRRCIR